MYNTNSLENHRNKIKMIQNILENRDIKKAQIGYCKIGKNSV